MEREPVGSGLRAGCRVRGELSPTRRITPTSLDESISRLAAGVRDWRPAGRFTFVRTLQSAPRNHGRVDAWQDALQVGGFVAVKRMPRWWIGSGPEDFCRRRPGELERPWHDLGVVRELGRRRYPYACRLEGIFEDETHVYAMTALATHGDLLDWSCGLPADPALRELEVAPVAAQLCVAVRQLHELGLAHCDISLENVVLSAGPQPGTPLQLKLIDFGMSALGRIQRDVALGKRSYCAPEVWRGGPVDAFLADAFSVGVALFCLAAGVYPWPDTRPGASRALEHAKRVGMEAHLAARRARGDGALPGLSRQLEALLAGLLEPDPASRMCLGESCYLSRRPFNPCRARPSLLARAARPPPLRLRLRMAPRRRGRPALPGPRWRRPRGAGEGGDGGGRRARRMPRGVGQHVGRHGRHGGEPSGVEGCLLR
ncbi:unnamed protein product [Prorocentrum cordatum]|uniref:Protein kinase domain-containing protein n=1 Tax=Prorocentrum cordatum TaxID=2364126 RepID=A0ABN9QYJ7_9DINO|nr:unnamed protein product [Polarella glacialis]